MERKHPRNAAHVHGWDDYGRQVRTAWAMWNVMWTRQTMQLQTACSVLNAAICASLCASPYSRCCPQCAHWCWKCACSRTHFSVAICHSHLFVNFYIRRYCIYSSLTNFADMSNIFFSVRSIVFIMKFWLFWKFLPMNVADSIVTAINIPQIMECSSPSPATWDILFCLFRTSSFTRFTNSVASLPMMKFWEFATSWELTLSICPDLSRSGSPYLTDCAVPSKRVASWWGRTCCTILQEVLSGCPDRSCVVASVFHSWEGQARSASNFE